MTSNTLFAILSRAKAPAEAVTDLLIRLWLAQLFWMTGLAGLLDWQSALHQAAHLASTLAMHPREVALAQTAARLAIPPLLIAGLGTRLAGLAMLALAFAAWRADPSQDAPLLWALLAGWYAAIGAGSLSLDQALARGIYDSALPLARQAGRALALLTRAGRPVLLLLLRAGIAAVLLRHGMIMAGAGWIIPTLLVAGLATRLSTLPLLWVTGAATMHAVSNEHLCWFLLLLLIAAFGPGMLSLDRVLGVTWARFWPAIRDADDPTGHARHRIVIVGGGFAGVAAARSLRGETCAITLIDQHNYHLFQPLLYQVATAGLSPADIATPIRSLFRNQPNLRVRLGRAVGIDTHSQVVRLADGAAIAYDTLLLATGTRHAYFGNDAWSQCAPGLKTIEDATEIRRRMLLAFERAEAEMDPSAREALLTFAVIGGGPTGVELAGAIAELARHGLTGEFRAIDPATARVLLLDGGTRVLATFPPDLSAAAARSLADLGVEVRLGAPVQLVTRHGVTVGGTEIACATCFWAAGVAASPAAAWLDAPADRAGRVKVGPDLTVPGHADIFAIGDTAAADAWNGKPVPGLAPAAKQAGTYAARVIAARLRGRPAPPPFRYRHAGSLATIGRRAAVAEFGKLHLHGALAWWVWGGVHVLFLAGARNRIVVAVQWFWAYLTFGRGIRLITGKQE
jgi:NADH dehydrogenase/putative oxidoreductase